MTPRSEPTPESRWPRFVYGAGEEPDYRFSFANERTFLAWIRTALALIAGGVALEAFRLSIPEALQRGLAVALVLLGILCAIASWVRWAMSERAMRRAEPLPAGRLGVVLATAVVLVAVAILVGAV